MHENFIPLFSGVSGGAVIIGTIVIFMIAGGVLCFIVSVSLCISMCCRIRFQHQMMQKQRRIAQQVETAMVPLVVVPPYPTAAGYTDEKEAPRPEMEYQP